VNFTLSPAFLLGLALICCTAGADVIISNCDNPAPWKGGKPETTLVKEGAGALRWVPSESPEISCSAIPHDWSGANCLAFWLYSAKATGTRISLILPSEDPTKDGMDYYSCGIAINWEGWRHVLLPFDNIGTVRNPVGWQKIESFRMHAAWDPATKINPEDNFVIDDIRLQTLSTVGPRMTDEEFFDALDLTRPGLEKVRAAVAAGDMAAAKSEFRTYFLARRDVKWFRNWFERAPHPEKRPSTSRADEALQHIYNFDGKKYDLGANVDWASNQRNEGEAATVEWNAALNRHFFFTDLAAAYEATGEEKYATELVNLMMDWIKDSPVLVSTSGNSPYHYAWETLNTACRAGDTWIEAIWRTADSPAWTPDALCNAFKSLAEHARHLVEWPSRGNWLTAESKAVYIVGMLLPEFKEAADWRKTGMARLYWQMGAEVYPDGLENELALGYNLWVLRNYSDIMDLALLNGRREEVPGDYQSLLERMYNYLLYATAPDGRVPGLNDSGNSNPAGYLTTAFGYFPARLDFQWGATGGKQGQRPAQTSYAFPYSGHYIMRSGWDSDSNYMLFDAGTWGSGHQHEDKLTIIMHALGREWIPDGGTHMYDKSRWRRYVLSTRGHNTARVDGQDQDRREDRDSWVIKPPFQPLPNPFVSNDSFDYVAGTYDSGYGPGRAIKVTHRREILFVKPGYWVIFDTFDPADDQPHQTETLFHIRATDATATGTLAAAEADGKHLWIAGVGDGLSLEIVKGLEEEPVQGWANNPWGPVPTAVYHRTGAGRQRNAYVLYPSRDAQAPKVEALTAPQGTDGIGLKITLPSGETHLILGRTGVAKDALAQPLGQVQSDADVCCVKLDAAGKPTAAFAVGGSYVNYQGASVWRP
jgi:hypothetical protein